MLHVCQIVTFVTYFVQSAHPVPMVRGVQPSVVPAATVHLVITSAENVPVAVLMDGQKVPAQKVSLQ